MSEADNLDNRRCFDEACGYKEHCVRWLNKEDEKTIKMMTMKPGYYPHTLLCDDFIGTNEFYSTSSWPEAVEEHA